MSIRQQWQVRKKRQTDTARHKRGGESRSLHLQVYRVTVNVTSSHRTSHRFFNTLFPRLGFERARSPVHRPPRPAARSPMPLSSLSSSSPREPRGAWTSVGHFPGSKICRVELEGIKQELILIKSGKLTTWVVTAQRHKDTPRQQFFIHGSKAQKLT